MVRTSLDEVSKLAADADGAYSPRTTRPHQISHRGCSAGLVSPASPGASYDTRPTIDAAGVSARGARADVWRIHDHTPRPVQMPSCPRIISADFLANLLRSLNSSGGISTLRTSAGLEQRTEEP